MIVEEDRYGYNLRPSRSPVRLKSRYESGVMYSNPLVAWQFRVSALSTVLRNAGLGATSLPEAFQNLEVDSLDAVRAVCESVILVGLT